MLIKIDTNNIITHFNKYRFFYGYLTGCIAMFIVGLLAGIYR
jgi:hypothetical protein